MYNARVTIRDASGRADKRWLQNDAEYYDVLRTEFGLNITDAETVKITAPKRHLRLQTIITPLRFSSTPFRR